MRVWACSIWLALALAVGAEAQAQTFDESMAAYRLGNSAAAIAGFRKHAEQGHALAQLFLGVIYEGGREVPKHERQAVFWFRKAAEQGEVDAQFFLGLMYANGRGVLKDEQRAVFWYRKAAEQGKANAQFNLGVMYANGQGVPKDDLQAYFWWLLAGAGGSEDAATNRDIVETRLTPEQRSNAQAAARNWQPKTAGQAQAATGAGGVDSVARPPGRTANVAPTQADSSGSGFRVARGAVVTNHHVIDGCSRLRVNGAAAQVAGMDARGTAWTHRQAPCATCRFG